MMNSSIAISQSECAGAAPVARFCPDPVGREHVPDMSRVHDAESTWDARLELQLERRGSGTRLVHNRHQGPLCVQKPFYPEGENVPHIYILHPPGGLVSGDRLEIDVSAGPGASALFTTPGAARIYRARPASSCNQQSLNALYVADGACIEWLPAETIVFPGAVTRIDTRIRLASLDSRLIAWDMISLGLPARAENFDQGSFSQRLRIDVGGRPCIIDGLVVDPAARDTLTSPAGLSGHPVLGWLIAGPWPQARSSDSPDALLETLREQICDPAPGLKAGITLLNNFILLRLLADSVMPVRECLQHAWTLIRPSLLGRDAVAPRIWNT